MEAFRDLCTDWGPMYARNTPGSIFQYKEDGLPHWKSRPPSFICLLFYFFKFYFITSSLVWAGDTQSVLTLFSMDAQGSNKIHQKAKTYI